MRTVPSAHGVGLRLFALAAFLTTLLAGTALLPSHDMVLGTGGSGTNTITSFAALEVTELSLALDASGNPVVSYQELVTLPPFDLDLKVLHCGDPTCTSGNTITAPDTEGLVGGYSSLELDAAGNPVVSYFDAGPDAADGDLNVLHCGNPTCTSGNSISAPDTAGFVGTWTSLALDDVGNPVVSYVDQTNGGIKVLHCGNPDCTDGNTIASVDSGERAVMTSLVLDNVGNPVVAYSLSGPLRVLRCGNPNCTAGNTITTVAFSGLWPSLVLDAVDRPIISYGDTGSQQLKVLHCGNPACTAGNSLTAPDAIGINGGSTSIELDGAGNPVISYQGTLDPAEDPFLKVLHCGNPTCTAGNSIASPDSIKGPTSLALSANGNPIVAYVGTNGDLRLLHCGDPSCAGGAPPLGLFVAGETGFTADGSVIAHPGDTLQWTCSTGGFNAEIQLSFSDNQHPLELQAFGNVLTHRAALSISLNNVVCRVNGQTVGIFLIAPTFVDPSGTVSDTNGIPVPGATVLLEHESGGAFQPVDATSGSPLIDPSINPQLTSLDGRYGWDVEPGTYRIAVEKDGCESVVSRIVTVPPPVTDLDVQLSCTDTDGDGIPDYLEAELGLDPSTSDTDGDGTADSDED